MKKIWIFIIGIVVICVAVLALVFFWDKSEKFNFNMTYGENKVLDFKNKNGESEELIYKSSNPDTVKVNSKGMIEVIKNVDSEVTITATTKDGKVVGTSKVNVKKVGKSVTGVSIKQGDKKTVYINHKDTKNGLQLSATVSPSDATNKSVTWSSSNKDVATIDSKGKVSVKGIGATTIKVTADNGKSDTYKLTVKEKAIVVITASQGIRMSKYYPNYKSKSTGYEYKNVNKNVGDDLCYDSNIDNVPKDQVGNMIFICDSGTGFDYQFKEGVNSAINILYKRYKGKKAYVDLTVFFTLSGNEVNHLSCDKINRGGSTYTVTNNDTKLKEKREFYYGDAALRADAAIQKIKDAAYPSVKGIVLSHSPLNTIDAIENHRRDFIVYSTDERACNPGKRSEYKYWLSNKKMSEAIDVCHKEGKCKNIVFLDNFKNIVNLVNENTKEFKWENNSEGESYRKIYLTTDGIHWNEIATKIYMDLAFDSAGM